MAPNERGDTMATATKVTIVQLLQELIDGMPAVFHEGDEVKIKSLRDSILKVRVLVGSGGNFERTNGTLVTSGRATGLTKSFDDFLSVSLMSGMIEDESLTTIIKREGKGRPRKVVSEDTSIDI